MNKTREVYVDNAATTAVKDEVLQAMIPYFTQQYGNASSLHHFGRAARDAVEDARAKVAKAIGADASEIYFTSCGSESDNWAIKGVVEANAKKGRHIITSKIEHPAVIGTCEHLKKQGVEVTYIGVDETGLIRLDELEKAIRPDTVLISVMLANNEIGTIQPVSDIAKIAKKHGILLHTDAVQAVGHVPVDVKSLGVDLLSLSAHKFYGPKGVAALYVRRGVGIGKFMDGGEQEKNRRAGTTATPLIVGLGRAIELACEDLEEKMAHLTSLRDAMIAQIEEKIPYCRLNGHRTARLPGNVNVSFEFIEGESMLMLLDLQGICASTGSACSSGSLEPSHVLLSIGLPHEQAHGSLRITFGDDNTMDDVAYIAQVLPGVVDRLRQMSPLYEEFLQNTEK